MQEKSEIKITLLRIPVYSPIGIEKKKKTRSKRKVGKKEVRRKTPIRYPAEKKKEFEFRSLSATVISRHP